MRNVKEITEEAFVHHRAGRTLEAAEIYDRLLGYTHGEDFNVLHAYGTLIAENEASPGLAAYLLQNAVKLYPAHSPAWVNLGITYQRLGMRKAWAGAIEEAIRLDPNNAIALGNMAGVFINTGQPAKVIEYASRALAIDPEDNTARYHMAFGLLEAGRFGEAWPYYESRWRQPNMAKNARPYKAPRWDGKKVGTLAIHGEQGVGDELLFLTCLEKVRPLADKIVIECADRLVSLLERSLDLPCYATHAELIEAHGEPDAYVPMGSLPGIVGLPSGNPYLKARQPAARNGTYRVGIAWKGGTQKTHKEFRTLKLAELKPILSVPGVEFVSVQYGEEPVLEEARAHGLKTNFAGRDMEAITDEIASCDLVVTVCQTAVHIAGGLGIPCWVLTPRKVAWRYVVEPMPWYRSVKLYRQDETEQWEPVIAKVAADLRAAVLP